MVFPETAYRSVFSTARRSVCSLVPVLSLAACVSALAKPPGDNFSAHFNFPRATYSSSTLRFNLPEKKAPERQTPAWTLQVYRWENDALQGEPLALGPGAIAEIGISGSGHYILEARSGDLTHLRVIRSFPGFVSILPPLLAIFLALVFRQVIPALFVGVWVGTSLLFNLNPWIGLLRLLDTYLVQAMTDPDHVRIIIFSMTLGGMVGLITRAGGAAGLIKGLSRLAVSRRMGQFSTWLMGLLIFFDDYSNTLMVGNTMRPFTDKLKISREKLSFIVDSTAAPVASVALISTWIGFELGLIGNSLAHLGLDRNAYWLFIKSLPYNFYSWACLVFVLMVAWSERDFGPMRRAEERAVKTGKLLEDNAQPLMDDEMTNLALKTNSPPHWYNAIIPIGVMSLTLLIGLYKSGHAAVTANGKPATLYYIVGESDPFQVLLWAAFAGTFTCIIMYLIQRILNLRECVEAFLIGFKSLTLAMIILTLARIIQLVCGELETANYILSVSSGVLNPGLLPALTFIIAAATSFSTGTSWGSMAILTPLIIPLAYQLPLEAGLPASAVELSLLGTVGAVLSGSVFGDHCSPISDTTIMSSMSCGADHVDHVRTQLPYALVVALAAVILGYLPAGMGLISPYLSLPACILLLWLILRIFGRAAPSAG
ncbi:MAG: Na+/H+ antiporter NhaC family protein [Candidatus Glassbacteria bacterium]|nr:Na+/H+ antiporter NhaC family protein [Candidatus Glassbacteria bacterium]